MWSLLQDGEIGNRSTEEVWLFFAMLNRAICETHMENKQTETKFLKLPEVLDRVRVGRSTWLQGCKAGRYPLPFRPSKRLCLWCESDIDAFLKSLMV